MRTALSALVLTLLAASACGGGDDDLDLSSRDPRCVAACPETTQSIEGVGDLCNTSSRTLCLDTCEARIAGQMPTCQTCLTEDACFDPEGCDDVVIDTGCNNGTATATGWNGTCNYPCGDMAARTNCLKQVSPTREVACTAEFKPTSECASVCGM
jgi:hypothetical protein